MTISILVSLLHLQIVAYNVSPIIYAWISLAKFHLAFYTVTLKVKENPAGDFKCMYRHSPKGSWTFSDLDQGWVVSDCTTESLKVIYICIHQHIFGAIKKFMVRRNQKFSFACSVYSYFLKCLLKLLEKKLMSSDFMML